LDIIKNGWALQKRFDNRLLKIKQAVNQELNRYYFNRCDALFFFTVSFICFAIGSIILFINFYSGFLSDWWLLPMGIGFISFMLFNSCKMVGD